ncbi:PspC domain-containing protein [Streptomyces sp. NPDC060194]|uniref:PspC domain-containing protein n=1 Tax=Streptomyces sp. NPDC060194 TaxID=3347069 RepID=UPI003669C8AD
MDEDTSTGGPAGTTGLRDGAGPRSTGSHAAPPAGAAGGGPPGPPPLRREQRHKLLAGVCSGLARRCDVDPVIFRIVLVVLSVTGGIGLVFYGFAWLFVAAEGEEDTEARRLLSGRVDGSALTALLCALVGLGLFLSMLDEPGILSFAVILSLLVAGAGYWSEQRRRHPQVTDPVTAQTVADAPPETKAPPAPGAPSWWRDPIVKDGRTGYVWGPLSPEARGRDMDAAVYLSTHPWESERRPASCGSGARPSTSTGGGERPTAGWVLLAAVLAGVAGAAGTWDGGPLGTSLQTGFACALAVLALGLVVSAFAGRLGFGTILLALVTAGLTAAASALPKDISTHWQDRSWTPATLAQVRPAYDVGTGYGRLDLSRIDLTGDRTVSTSVDAAAGMIEVTVPADATVRVDASADLGSVALPPGDDAVAPTAPTAPTPPAASTAPSASAPPAASAPPSASAPPAAPEAPAAPETPRSDLPAKDIDVRIDQRRTVTLVPPGGAVADGGTLDLTLTMGVGHVEVHRAQS